ncbi:PREDICTED: uncharacterized protein LOC106148296 [Chinchilla lanigera]|uniref:uncharacterized protein LOC106148296 n=1 Tax=Chinchilla lanigera TaxID=34839 RepID=UPI0006991AD5|nr:PREDICTED: uncharacterized protein LOC106148296 [Chinchilla lanigera]
MIRETCSRTGTLLSLKAVVMKQPKVSAAITLSEKANREFARDSTVFIATVSPEPRLHTGTRARVPAAVRLPHTRAARRAHVPGARAAAAPPPFRSSNARAPARGARPPPEKLRADRRLSASSPPLHPQPCAAANERREREGRGFVTGDPTPPLSSHPSAGVASGRCRLLTPRAAFRGQGLGLWGSSFLCASHFLLKSSKTRWFRARPDVSCLEVVRCKNACFSVPLYQNRSKLEFKLFWRIWGKGRNEASQVLKSRHKAQH